MKIIPISGVIGWDVTPRDVRDALQAANGEDVTFEVASPGGFIAPGLEIFSMIRNYAGRTTAKLVGYAMSMAAYIPQACDRVVAEDTAVYMIHNARGGIWGDHNDVLGYGGYLKGLSGISAREFTKRTEKRGKAKSLAEIEQMMDKETFFFGDGMVEAGLVDEIIVTEKDKDEETAMATAKATFTDAMARMAADQVKAREDMEQARAIMLAMEQQVSPPAPAAGTIKQEVQQMDLKTLLAANPAAQAEFDAAVQAARTEGETALKGRIDAAAPFLASKDYPQAIKDLAVQVVKGDVPASGLTAAVATVDAVREDAAATKAAAATEEAPATPAAPAAQVVDGLVTDAASMEATAAAMKKAQGRV